MRSVTVFRNRDVVRRPMVAVAAILVAATAAFWTAPASAQAAPAATESLTDQVFAKAKRLHEFLQVLKNNDPAVKLAAMQIALKDPDPVLRSMAISAYLTRFDALTPEIVLDKDSQTAPEDMPRLSMSRLQWSDDKMSFNGNYDTTCSGGIGVRGQIAGGKLAITYDGVCLRPALLGSDSGGDAKKAAEESLTACELTLTPDASDDSLDGVLHCNGMSASLPVRLPFGS